MERIDTALEQRVWQRVYSREPNVRGEQVPLGQLYSTARDCAGLYRSLRQESRGTSAQRFARLEQEMEQAARRLASMMEGQERLAAPTGCPGCSHRQKLERLSLWMQEWSRRCREYSGDIRQGRALGELARIGENHCHILSRVLGK